MKKTYIFQTSRLGFRDWIAKDLADFAAMNADPTVMRYFPRTFNEAESAAGIQKYQQEYAKRNYTYFAVDMLETGEFIGFIGLFYQTYDAPFTPATDIGWRLKESAWGKGYATEGAKACLDYAFQDLGLTRIVSVCPSVNTPSENVMKKIGMIKKGTFKHPKLGNYPKLESCVWYEIIKNP